MALRWTEGGESRQEATYFTRAYATVAGALVSIAAPRKGGAGSLRATNFTLTTYPLVGSDTNTWIVGFGHYAESIPATTVTVMNASATAQMNLLFLTGATNNSFKIQVKRGATVLGTTAEMSMNQWHYFELKVVVRTSTNGSFDLHDNGVSILSASGINTANTGSDGASVVQFNWGGATCRIDDVYICDDAGGVHDTFLSPQVILRIAPDGDGASSQWITSNGLSAHFNLVNDAANSPSDSTRVDSNTDNDVDLYTFSDTTGLAADGTLTAVMMYPELAMRSSGQRGIKIRFRASGGGTGDGSELTISSKTLKIFPVPFDQDPAAASAWTKTALDGGQLGILDVEVIP